MSNTNYIKTVLITLGLLLAFANVSLYAFTNISLLKKETSSKTIFITKTTNTSVNYLDFCTEFEDELEDDHEDEIATPHIHTNYTFYTVSSKYTNTSINYFTNNNERLHGVAQFPIYLRICSFRV